MATYLQGEQGIIPALQPFTPDLNLISGVLQQKQTQFDTNYKYLNKIYNTYVFSDLSREDNIKRRDGFVKQMDLDLKRIASLDLAEQKNVDQAVRVFAPLYEDPYLMVDMAKTKNYKSRRSSAVALQTSLDKDQRSQYWGKGVQYMDYMMEDFKAMPLDQTLSSPDITYTPYVNIAEKLAKVAKDANLNVEADSFTKDGMYIVTDKNGSLLVDPLTRLFSQTLANDPAIQDIYRVRAYVDRKNYMYANQDRVGSLEGAEQEYLVSKYNELNAFAAQWNQQNNRELNDKEHTVKEINQSYQNGTYTDKTQAALQEQEQSKSRIQSEVNQSSGLVEELSDGESSTLTTAKSAENITANIDLLRNVVDNGMSTLLMQDDIVGSATAYAFKDVKHKINVNPVGLENLRHAHRNSEIDRRAAKNEKAVVLKANLDSGVWVSDMYGEVSINPELTARLTKTVKAGTSTDAQDPRKVNRQYESDLANEKASPAVNMIFDYLQNEVTAGRMSEEQAGAFFSYKGKTLQEVKSIYERTPGTFFTTRGFSVQKTMNDFMRYAQTNKKGDPAIDAMINSPEFASLNEYSQFAASAKKVRDENLNIARKLVGEGVYEAGLANDYNIIDPDILVNLTQKERQVLNKKLPQLFITNLSAPVSEETFKRAAMKDKELSPIINKINNSRRLQIALGPNQGLAGATRILSGSMDQYLGRVYDVYSANWDTKKDGTKFKTYYVGDYVPGAGGSEYALSASETKGLTVFPNAYGTPNRTVWTELMADVNNMSRNLADPKDAKISFGGLTKSSSNDTETGLAVLSYLNSKMAGKEKPKNFEIYSAQIAMEDPKKGAMVIYPNAEDLDKLVGTKNEPGIITAEERNAIIKNGISIVGDRNNFNNFLMKEGNITPMQAVVNANGYEYKNPGGAGAFKITRSGDNYNVTGYVNARDVNTGEMTRQSINQPASFGSFGNSLDSYVQQLQQNLIAVNQQNNNIYRKFNPVNQ
jgi:hypothetical protein